MVDSFDADALWRCFSLHCLVDSPRGKCHHPGSPVAWDSFHRRSINFSYYFSHSNRRGVTIITTIDEAKRAKREPTLTTLVCNPLTLPPLSLLFHTVVFLLWLLHCHALPSPTANTTSTATSAHPHPHIHIRCLRSSDNPPTTTTITAHPSPLVPTHRQTWSTWTGSALSTWCWPVICPDKKI